MYNNQRYAAKGITAAVPLSIQHILWYMIHTMKGDKDYLQVFELSQKDGKQHIVHRQEQPDYSMQYTFNVTDPIAAKIYVIDDGSHSTMLLAEEY
ncbi:MAG: DUF960 domain-containing protein [Oscillospiraceae bacterium]